MFKTRHLIIIAAVMLGHNMHAKVPTFKEVKETTNNHRGKIGLATGLSIGAGHMQHELMKSAKNLKTISNGDKLLAYETNKRWIASMLGTIAMPAVWVCHEASEHYIVAGTLVALSTVVGGYYLLTTDNSETEEETA